MASHPTSIKAFTTKLDQDVIQPGHVNDLQDEVVAIETDLQTNITPLVTAITPEFGTWTPIDGSGAGLVLNNLGSAWAKMGRLVFIWMHISYPVTATANNATIHGLPFANGIYFCGLYQSYGPNTKFHIPPSQSIMYLLDGTTSNYQPNSALSGQQLIANGVLLLP